MDLALLEPRVSDSCWISGPALVDGVISAAARPKASSSAVPSVGPAQVPQQPIAPCLLRVFASGPGEWHPQMASIYVRHSHFDFHLGSVTCTDISNAELAQNASGLGQTTPGIAKSHVSKDSWYLAR